MTFKRESDIDMDGMYELTCYPSTMITDSALISLAQYCTQLRSLNLSSLPQITAEGA
jgi:hypothetical protein